jgi:hypothetical protein
MSLISERATFPTQRVNGEETPFEFSNMGTTMAPATPLPPRWMWPASGRPMRLKVIAKQIRLVRCFKVTSALPVPFPSPGPGTSRAPVMSARSLFGSLPLP